MEICREIKSSVTLNIVQHWALEISEPMGTFGESMT